MKKNLFIVLFSLLFLPLPGLATGTEVEYPSVPGVATPTATTTFPEYVKYLVNFSITVSGIIALGVLIWAGFLYLTSAGNMDQIEEAKRKIFRAFTGGRGTVEEQRKLGGNPEICKVFEFFRYHHPSSELVEEIYGKCKAGELVCGECKKICAEFIANFLEKHGRKFEKNITRSYISELSEAYNNFFFKYNNTPLLIVNTTEIDFVKRDKDFDELFHQIFRQDRGFIEYFNPEP